MRRANVSSDEQQELEAPLLVERLDVPPMRQEALYTAKASRLLDHLGPVVHEPLDGSKLVVKHRLAHDALGSLLVVIFE